MLRGPLSQSSAATAAAYAAYRPALLGASCWQGGDIDPGEGWGLSQKWVAACDHKRTRTRLNNCRNRQKRAKAKSCKKGGGDSHEQTGTVHWGDPALHAGQSRPFALASLLFFATCFGCRPKGYPHIGRHGDCAFIRFTEGLGLTGCNSTCKH